MAKKPWTGTLVARKNLGPQSAQLTFWVDPKIPEEQAFDSSASSNGTLMGEVLQFRGGQYVILDTGLVEEPRDAELAPKPIKRAFTIMDPRSLYQGVKGEKNDAENFEELTKRVDRDAGTYVSLIVRGFGRSSRHLLSLPIGHRLHWSGPWGKVPDLRMFATEVVVVACGTGITGAISLLSGFESSKFKVLWIEKDPFLDPSTYIPSSSYWGRFESEGEALEFLRAENKDQTRPLMLFGDGRCFAPFMEEGFVILFSEYYYNRQDPSLITLKKESSIVHL